MLPFEEMCKRFFIYLFSHIDPEDLDMEFVEVWLDSKKEWTVEKRAKYLRIITLQKAGILRDFVGCFRSMVKKGEVYYVYEDDL